MTTAEFDRYRAGLEELLFVSPVIGNVARSMGTPQWDTQQGTAYITFDTDQKSIVFAFNPDFILTLSDDEVAGVLAHETHHLILNHLSEMMDNVTYPQQQALIKAQECIINDTISFVYQLPLPEGVMRGEELVGENLSSYATFDAYQLFVTPEDESAGNQGDSDDSGSGGEDEGAADSGAGDGSCGGIHVPEDAEGDFNQAIEDMLSDTAKAMGISSDELKDAIDNTTPGGYSPTGSPSSTEGSISQERMNWRELLARINPKVLEAGKKRARVRNNWARNNRRMASVYPKVILPVTETVKPKSDDKGDTLPTMVIALDLSGSIPRTLISTLQGLLNEIPEDLIKAYPCTWATSLIPYDEEHRYRVASGGTNIHNVSAYVEKIRRDTGTEPYVLVITDGEFAANFKRPGREWFFMGVNHLSVQTIMRGSRWSGGGHVKPGETVYCVDDFKV